MSPDPSPPRARSLPGMVYASRADRIILFGGFADLSLDDTWEYDFNSDGWAERAPASGPSGRFASSMAYDEESDRIILFGGVRGDLTPLGGTWAYDYDNNTWTNMAPFPQPSPRWEAPMTYDAESDRIILFGGTTGFDKTFNSTWAYDFNSNTWTTMDPAMEPPGVRGGGFAYDRESDRVILFGGEVFPLLTDATWAYDYNANTWSLQTHPSGPRALQASAGDAVVDLTWIPPLFDYGSPISYWIYRGTTSGDLSFIADVGTSPAYTDTNVTNGVTYYYRINAINIAGESPPSDEVPATPTPSDIENPIVVITSPEHGTRLADTTVIVRGTASDDIAVDRVELSADGESWVLATGTTNWSGSLFLQEGPNTIHARAIDSSGKMAQSNISVTVEPLPPPPPPCPLLVCLVVPAVVAGAAAPVLFLVWRRRKAK